MSHRCHGVVVPLAAARRARHRTPPRALALLIFVRELGVGLGLPLARALRHGGVLVEGTPYQVSSTQLASGVCSNRPSSGSGTTSKQPVNLGVI